MATWEEAFLQAKQDLFGAASRSHDPPELALFAPGNAISDFWVLHIAELGPACGPERPGVNESGEVVAVFQAFSTAIYKWTPEAGVEKAA